MSECGPWASGFLFSRTCLCGARRLFQLMCCKPIEPYQQNIWRTAWAEHTDCIQCVDDLVNFCKFLLIYLTELCPFSDFGILCSKAILSTKYLETAWARIMISGIMPPTISLPLKREKFFSSKTGTPNNDFRALALCWRDQRTVIMRGLWDLCRRW